MTFCSCNARQSAPTDGRDESGNVIATSVRASSSKQNSDANGFRYQWGRKDPFTFATNSQQWGNSDQKGKYPLKIYTIDGVLIYQENRGSDNKGKQPAGGIIVSSTLATSMMTVIKQPITCYWSPINQTGHTKSLWSYYWTSYSRGTDGNTIVLNSNEHNDYLDGYISNRSKSIYDPCPFGFRSPTNGAYNQLTSETKWVYGSFDGGLLWAVDLNVNWNTGLGIRSNIFERIGDWGCFAFSTIYSSSINYMRRITSNGLVSNNDLGLMMYYGISVRCIEDCGRLVYHRF